MSQREFAAKVGVSHGTINNILAGIQPKKITTLERLAKYLHVRVDQLYGQPSDAQAIAEDTPSYSGAGHRLARLAKDLDDEEVATLERCAEAFIKATPDVRQHLIGQLKIIERLVEHESGFPDGRAPTIHKKQGSS